MGNRLSLRHVQIIEAALIGVFFIQALRLFIGLVYSQIASASLVSALDPAAIDRATPGFIDPAALSNQLALVGYLLLLPLLALIMGRVRALLIAAALVTAVGRALINLDTPIPQLVAAGLTVSGGLFYLAMLIRHRVGVLPYLLILGFAGDQLFRAAGDTLDPTWSATFAGPQIALSVAAVALSLITTIHAMRTRAQSEAGLLTLWGGISLGALLYLELALLALPNAIAGRAATDYTTFVPLTLAATLLPLVPWVRVQMRAFVGAFDGGLRGWLWMLLLALLLVLGLRLGGLIAGVALVLAQFGVSLMWWWLTRPQAQRERSLNAVWLLLAGLVLALLVMGDTFTYEYAFVRDIAPGSDPINEVITGILRGFRGMGLVLVLFSIFLGALPMTLTQRRIPWPSGTTLQSALGIVLVAAAATGAAYAARPVLIEGVRNVDLLRVGTYNIHAGYNEFFDYNLPGIAQTIRLSGANVVLLQEIEAGRLTSFGVDQPLWLARRLGMDTRFYPTNEGLQGLAVLSNVEIVFDEGRPLPSAGLQTGVQRVQVRPDEGVITLYNTWLGLLLQAAEGESLADQEQDQQRQLNQIFTIISADHPSGFLGRIIVGGTFNNTPTSPLIEQMRAAGFRDTFEGQPRETSFTFWRASGRARFDYLWIRPPLQLVSAGVMDTAASDHRMAVIELQIARR